MGENCPNGRLSTNDFTKESQREKNRRKSTRWDPCEEGTGWQERQVRMNDRWWGKEGVGPAAPGRRSLLYLDVATWILEFSKQIGDKLMFF